MGVYYPNTGERTTPASFMALKCGSGGTTSTTTANPIAVHSVISCDDTDGGRNIAVNGQVTFTLDNGKTLTIDEGKYLRSGTLDFWGVNTGYPTFGENQSFSDTSVFLRTNKTVTCVDGVNANPGTCNGNVPNSCGYGYDRAAKRIDTQYQWEWTCAQHSAEDLRPTFSDFVNTVTRIPYFFKNNPGDGKDFAKAARSRSVERMTNEVNALRRRLLSVQGNALAAAGLTLEDAVNLGIHKYIEFIPGQNGEICSGDGTHVQ